MKECFQESEIFGKHSIRNYLTYYQINAAMKINYLNEIIYKGKEVQGMVETEIFEEPMFNFYWLENSLFIWEDKDIDHFGRYIEAHHRFSLYATLFECFCLLLVSMRLIFIE